MLTCSKCGAVCQEKKDEKRFQRRHPKKCVAHNRFQENLAAGTASVDYDDLQELAQGNNRPWGSGGIESFSEGDDE